MAERDPLLSIVIPAYNEAEMIPALLTRIQQVLETLAGVSVEVIFVDDHSTDETPVLLRQACAGEPRFRWLRLSANRGSHIAIFAGLEYASGDCAVFLAADLQDPPELIKELLLKWREGYRVVWAVRERRDDISFVNEALANAFYFLLNRFGNVRLAPKGSDFVLIDRDVLEAIMQSTGSRFFLMAEISNAGFEQTEIPYVKAARERGVSKWNLRMKIAASLDAFCSFSYVPLRLSSVCGIFSSILGIAYAALVFFRRVFIDIPVEGWSSLMVVVLLVGGAQMIMLGIMGEYMIRVYDETRSRPKYYLEDSAGFPDVTDDDE